MPDGCIRHRPNEDRRHEPCSRSSTSPNATGRWSRSTAPRSAPTRAASSASSAPTARARRPPCAASSGWPGPIAARSAGRARSSTATRGCASATCPSSAASIPRMRVAEQLSYFAQQHGMRGKAANAAASRWLERMGLADRAKSKLEELSHGNQQRDPAGDRARPRPGAAGARRAVLGSRPDRHRDDDRRHPRAGRGRRRGRLLQPSARPGRGRLRGRRDHRPRPDRRLGRHRGSSRRVGPPAPRGRGRRLRRRLARRRAPT